MTILRERLSFAHGRQGGINLGDAADAQRPVHVLRAGGACAQRRLGPAALLVDAMCELPRHFDSDRLQIWLWATNRRRGIVALFILGSCALSSHGRWNTSGAVAATHQAILAATRAMPGGGVLVHTWPTYAKEWRRYVAEHAAGALHLEIADPDAGPHWPSSALREDAFA